MRKIGLLPALSLCFLAAPAGAVPQEAQPPVREEEEVIDGDGVDELPKSAALDLWHKTLTDACKAYVESEPTADERLEEMEGVGSDVAREVATATQDALDALDLLFAARVRFGEACLALYRESYSGAKKEGEQAMRECWLQTLEDCMLNDLQGLLQNYSWLEARIWPQTPCHVLADGMPAVYAAENERPGKSVEIGWRVARSVQKWEKMLDSAALDLADEYDSGSSCGDSDLFTNVQWEDFEQDGLSARMFELRGLFLLAENAWKEYRRCMDKLFLPHPSMGGRSSGTFCYIFDRQLLTGREKYLARLAAGMDRSCCGVQKAGTMSLSSAVSDYALGEIVRYAYLFRHPALEGNPWCVSLGNDGSTSEQASFIPLAADAVSEKLIASLPESFPKDGANIRLRGYQDIEVTGEPYEQERELGFYLKPVLEKLPQNAYRARVVFRVLSFEPWQPGDSD